jgi:FkbM family methyltransferase
LPLFLNRGDIIVDCGAYSGDTAKYFLESLDYDCSIYAIEPFIHNYNALQNWIINNNLTDKVIALHCALGSKSGDAFMHSIVKEPNPTMDAKIISQETKPLNMFEVFEVKIRTLDDLFPDQLSGITFIKMDIEGAEYDAICGASELINIKHPNMMISAYHEPEHLWTIPLKVMDLSDDYLIYAGHQPYAPLEIEYYFYSKKVCR